MPPPLDVRATEAYRTRIRNLRLTGAATLAAIWAALTGIDPEDEEAFADRSTPVLTGLQGATTALTVGYFGLLSSGARVDTAGLTVAQDLRHPFIGVRKALKEGAEWEAAQAAGRARAEAMASERVMLTQAATAERIDATGKVVGWRRVPQGATCSYCIVVSTQRYRTAETASNVGHRNKGRLTCDCDVVPIVGDKDPGQVINRPTLKAWKAANKADDKPAYFDATTLDPAPRPVVPTDAA